MFLPGLIIFFIIWGIYAIVSDHKTNSSLKNMQNKSEQIEAQKFYQNKNDMDKLTNLNNWKSNNK